MKTFGLRDPAFIAQVASGGAPTFPNLPGLVGHYEADTLALSDNDPVSNWPDLGANGYDMSVTSAAPTFKVNIQNGLPGVLFDGATTRLQTPALPSEASTIYSLYVVSKFTDADAAECIVGYGNSRGFKALKTGSNRAVTHRTVADLVDAAATNATELWAFVKNSTPLTQFWLNSVLTTISNSGASMLSPTTGPIHAGFFHDVAGFHLSGYIFEFALYNTNHSTAERESMQDYLNAKWAIY